MFSLATEEPNVYVVMFMPLLKKGPASKMCVDTIAVNSNPTHLDARRETFYIASSIGCVGSVGHPDTDCTVVNNLHLL